MENLTIGPRMAKRQVATKRAHKKVLGVVGILAFSLSSFGSMPIVHAAAPGSLTIVHDYPTCFPAAAATISVPALATGDGKSNIVTATWTGGGIKWDFTPLTIDQSQYANALRSDRVSVFWTGGEGPDLAPFTATLTVTLWWVMSNGNTRPVATATASRDC
jgi:hypothetical protein